MIGTVLGAVVALPRQLLLAWRASSNRTRTNHAVEGAVPMGRALIGLPIALVVNLAALVIVFAVARAVYYPFWAAGASREALERSWGGPGAVGATLAHWLVAAVTIVFAYAAIVVLERVGGGFSETRGRR
jgi:hypothetical protein